MKTRNHSHRPYDNLVDSYLKHRVSNREKSQHSETQLNLHSEVLFRLAQITPESHQKSFGSHLTDNDLQTEISEKKDLVARKLQVKIQEARDRLEKQRTISSYTVTSEGTFSKFNNESYLNFKSHGSFVNTNKEKSGSLSTHESLPQ